MAPHLTPPDDRAAETALIGAAADGDRAARVDRRRRAVAPGVSRLSFAAVRRLLTVLAARPRSRRLAAAPAAQAACEDIRWEVRWQPDPFGTSGGSLIRVPVCHDGAPSTRAGRKQQPEEPTRRQLRKLRFAPSEAVAARVRDRMIEQLAWGEQAEQVARGRSPPATSCASSTPP